MIKCVYCGGRGWSWVGVGDNADRELCDECGGVGRLKLNPTGVGGVVIIVISALTSLALILWIHAKTFGGF